MRINHGWIFSCRHRGKQMYKVTFRVPEAIALGFKMSNISVLVAV